MNVHLLSIGDELLIGQTANTNAAWMGKRLTEDGWRVSRVVTLSDDPDTIRRELDRALEVADAVLLTGGLGPTKDDLTKHVLAEHFGTELVMHEEIAAQIQAWFESRNVPFLEVNRLQAMLPRACTVLPNPLGTASGMWFERPSGKVVVSMPGVPYEMEGLMDNEVLPRLRSHFKLPTTLYETVVTAGIGESSLAALVAEWEEALPAKGVSLAYLPSPGQVKVRLGVQGPAEDRTSLMQLLKFEADTFVALAADHVIGRGNSGLPEAAHHASETEANRLYRRIVHGWARCVHAHLGAWRQCVDVGRGGGLRQQRQERDSGSVLRSPCRARRRQRGRGESHGTRRPNATGHGLGGRHVGRGRSERRNGRKARGHGVDGRCWAGGRTGVVPPVWFTTGAHCPAGVTPNFDPSSRSLERRRGWRLDEWRKSCFFAVLKLEP